MAIKKTTKSGTTKAQLAAGLKMSELSGLSQDRESVANRAVEATKKLSGGGTKMTTPVVDVVRYEDNPDGSTTNFLSDGSKSTVKYSKQKDGSLQPYEVTPKKLGLSYSQDPYEAEIDKRTKSLIDTYGGMPNEKKVRRSVLDQFQTEIDALDRASAQEQARLTTQYGVVEKGRLGSDSAIQARRGLLGSDFGSARTENISSEVRGNRDEAIGAVRSAYDQRKQSLFTQARTLANQEYQNKLEAYRTGASATVQYLRNKQTAAEANATKLAKQAYLSEIDLTDPENAMEIKALAQQVGVTPETFVQIYQDYKATQDAARAEAERKQLIEDRTYNLDVAKENNLNTREGNKLNFDIEKFNLEYALNTRKVDAEIRKIEDDIANGGGDGLLTPEQAEKFGVPYGTTKSQMAGVIPGQEEKIAEIDTKLSATQNVSRLVKELINHEGRAAATGGNRLLTAVPSGFGTSARDFVAKFDELKAVLALDNISKLKGTGSLSDKEGEMLANAASSLRRNISEGAFVEELKRLESTADERIRKLETLKTSSSSNSLFNEFEQSGGSEGTNPKAQSVQSSRPLVDTKTLAKAVLPKYPDGTNLGNKNGQCITFLHKIADFPPIGDGKNEKIANLNKLISQGKGVTKEQLPSQAKVGMILISNDNKTYGHGSMINAISEDGKFARLTESNRLKPGTVTHTRVVALNDPSLYGAIIPNSYKLA